MLKFLTSFFDWDAFSKDKDFIVVTCRKWIEYSDNQSGDKKVLGTTIEALISRDETDYGKENNKAANLYEKVSFKVPKENVKFDVNTFIRPINAKVTVYGEYKNMLSIKADDIEVVNKPSSFNNFSGSSSPSNFSNVNKQLVPRKGM